MVSFQGIPIVTEPEDLTSDFNIPRNTFQECIDRLYADVDSALKLLPEDYGAIASEDLVPAKYRSPGCQLLASIHACSVTMPKTV